MSNIDFFEAGTQFERTINKHCQRLGWKPQVISGEGAILLFDFENGRRRMAVIRHENGNLEFFCPTFVVLEKEDSLDADVATMLLGRNAHSPGVFWCIREHTPSFALGVICSGTLGELNQVNLERVVETLMNECMMFENSAYRLLGNKLPAEARRLAALCAR